MNSKNYEELLASCRRDRNLWMDKSTDVEAHEQAMARVEWLWQVVNWAHEELKKTGSNGLLESGAPKISDIK